jgi:hypothetical protein
MYTLYYHIIFLEGLKKTTCMIVGVLAKSRTQRLPNTAAPNGSVLSFPFPPLIIHIVTNVSTSGCRLSNITKFSCLKEAMYVNGNSSFYIIFECKVYVYILPPYQISFMASSCCSLFFFFSLCSLVSQRHGCAALPSQSLCCRFIALYCYGTFRFHSICLHSL